MGPTRRASNQTAGKGGLISEKYFQILLNHYPQLFNVNLAKMKKLEDKDCDFVLRGHTLITLAHRGTYLVCKMLTTVL